MKDAPQPSSGFSDDVEMALKLAEANMGFRPNSLRIMAKRPGLLKGFMALMMAMNTQDYAIDVPLRQMIAYMTSYASGCRYCQAHTSHGALHAGVDPEKIENLWQYEQSTLFDDREKTALSFAFAAGQVPNAVTNDHYVALRKHFSEEEIIDITFLISSFGFLNRWNDSMGTELESTPVDFAQDHLQNSGWETGKHASQI